MPPGANRANPRRCDISSESAPESRSDARNLGAGEPLRDITFTTAQYQRTNQPLYSWHFLKSDCASRRHTGNVASAVGASSGSSIQSLCPTPAAASPLDSFRSCPSFLISRVWGPQSLNKPMKKQFPDKPKL